MPNLNNFY